METKRTCKEMIVSPRRETLNSILAVILTLGTLFYLGVLLASFHHIGGVVLQNGLTAIYAMTLGLYIVENESSKAAGKTTERMGQWFVFVWILVGFWVYGFSSVRPNDYVVPDYFIPIVGQVLGLYGVTQNRDKIKAMVRKWIES